MATDMITPSIPQLQISSPEQTKLTVADSPINYLPIEIDLTEVSPTAPQTHPAIYPGIDVSSMEDVKHTPIKPAIVALRRHMYRGQEANVIHTVDVARERLQERLRSGSTCVHLSVDEALHLYELGMTALSKLPELGRAPLAQAQEKIRDARLRFLEHKETGEDKVFLFDVSLLYASIDWMREIILGVVESLNTLRIVSGS